MDEGNSSIRPGSWDDYIGQERIKRELQVRAKAAAIRSTPLDHMLFDGPPGAGKTSLAAVVAKYMGDEFESLVMPVTINTLASMVRYHQGVLLLDEVHRLSKGDQHSLLTLIEDGYIQTARGRRIDADWLTVIAATTERRLIIPPLRDRFVRIQWDTYNLEELQQIAEGIGDRLNIPLPPGVSLELARACGGVPRQAAHLVKAYADLTLANGEHPDVQEVLDLLRIEPDGLTEEHMRYLTTLRDLGCQKGERTLATVLSLDPKDLQLIETVLAKRGYIEYGDAGRELTRQGLRRIAPEVRR
jgi:holliday junction DNA helicase RuvB